MPVPEDDVWEADRPGTRYIPLKDRSPKHEFFTNIQDSEMDKTALFFSHACWICLRKRPHSLCIMGKHRRKIRLIEGNAKSRQQNKFTCKETLRRVFIYLRPRTHTPLLHTVYVYTVYLFTQGRWEGGRVEPEISWENDSLQSWVENNNMTDSISSL